MTQQQASEPVVPVKDEKNSLSEAGAGRLLQNADRSKKVNTGTKSPPLTTQRLAVATRCRADFCTQRAQSSAGAAISCASRVLRRLGASNTLRHDSGVN
jgi:hypothetical protein